MANPAVQAASGGAAPPDPNARKGNGQEPVILPNPFTRAAREHYEGPFVDNTEAGFAGGSSFAKGPFDIPAIGYFKAVILKVEATGGTGVAGVAREDAPYNVLTNVLLSDVNGTPIVGPIDGWDLYLINKYGGYAFDAEPENHPDFSAVAATGNFTFFLRLPVEITARDALGALPNQSAAQTYKLQYTINDANNVYSTLPTTRPAVRVRAWLEAWTQPGPTDLRGVPNMQAPPAVGTTQFWTKSSHVTASGDQRIRLPRVGNLIRTLILQYRDDAATPVRTTTEFPDPFRVELDGRILYNVGRDVWRGLMRERHSVAAEVGIIVLDYSHDLDGKVGGELRDLYLVTTQATRLELVGNFGGSGGTLQIITNDVAPAGDVYVEQ